MKIKNNEGFYEFVGEYFKGTPSNNYLKLTNDFKFKSCYFENFFINDALFDKSNFVDCYFEYVEFSSIKHLTGIGGTNVQYPMITMIRI